MVSIDAVVREFVQIQARLVDELKSTLGPRDWRHLTNVPRNGNLESGGKLWRYKVHGTGIRFVSESSVIDMNRGLDGDPMAFDAGRLVEYLASIEQKSVAWAGRDIEFDYQHGPAILRDMHAKGAIQRVEDADGELYTLPT